MRMRSNRVEAVFLEVADSNEQSYKFSINFFFVVMMPKKSTRDHRAFQTNCAVEHKTLKNNLIKTLVC